MKNNTILLLALLLSAAAAMRAENGMVYGASVTANAGSGDLAPYFLTTGRDGTLTQPMGITAEIHARRSLDPGRRFDYGFGAEGALQLTKGTDYMRYSSVGEEWRSRTLRPAGVRLRGLWGEVKFRGVFLTAGLKPYDRSYFDSPIASGDITMSNNAAPIPQVRAGFIDFQNVPFTNGWLQIQGELAYGKLTDNEWLHRHSNHYYGFVTTGVWMHYARCYFRSNPEKPFSIMVGMQHGAQFGGTHTSYLHGDVTEVHTDKVRLKTFFEVFIPRRDGSGSNAGDQAYYSGNHLGSWDVKARYRFRDGSTLLFTWQSPWEDGSGIGKLNGWDGVYGLEYRFRPGLPIHAVRFEYLDFRNQSGPIHWAPGDHPGTSMGNQATGNDNYYNNFNYNGWANYGMSIGTPFLPGPLFNTDGLMEFADNKVYGFHFGAEGEPLPGLECRLLWTWRKAAGTNNRPRLHRLESTSMLIGAKYDIPGVKGLSTGLDIAFDTGKYLGNKFGVCASVSYSGFLSFTSKNKK